MSDSNYIYISSKNNDIVISGSSSKILRNRFAMMYLRRNLSYELVGDSIVVKNVTDINSIMSHIDTLAKYISCEIRFSDEINNDIKEYEIKELQFAEFSHKARDIRDNHPVIGEFKSFEESLISNMKNRQLYQLQMLSAYHMAFAQNSCNFSVPGAGKTSVVYGAYCYLKNLPVDDPKHVDKLLIIGPLSSFGPWENEYESCFGTKVKSMRLSGGVTKEKKSIYLHGLDTDELTLTSYQSVISIKDDLKFFVSHNNVMVVLDEAHKIKNSQGAITAVSTMEIAPYAKARVVLTGTPAPNGYEDLYNLFKFIWPERDVISFNVAQLENMSRASDDPRVNDLINQISPFFIRIRKSDLGIPPAIFEEIVVPMSDSQRVIYDAIESQAMESLSETDETSPYLARLKRAKLIRLMQVATNPELLRQPLANMFDEEGFALEESEEDISFIEGVRRFVSDEIPNKFIKAADITENIINNGGKVVIWASFIRNIEKLKSYLNSRGINCKELYGATPINGIESENDLLNDTRESIVNEFNRDDSSFRVIIANPFAVAESISLHKKCHNAIYLERSFNAAHFIQSKDRIHRYGLKEDTITKYYYLISESSIDETINDRLKLKEMRLNEIMESMPIPLFDNTLESGGIEDIKAILRDYATRAKKI